MSAGLKFTIMQYLDQGVDPDELLDEIKTEWPVKDNPKELERAERIIENYKQTHN